MIFAAESSSSFLLWDVQNVSRLSLYKWPAFINTLFTQSSKRYGPLIGFKAYGSLGSKTCTYFRNACLQYQGEYISIESTEPNALDYQLMDDCIQAYIAGMLPRTVILIAGDYDFQFLVHWLKKRSVKVVVIARSKSTSYRLRLAADEFYDISDFLGTSTNT